MTDDNDALAAQVEDLRGAVERCQAIVTAWDAHLETEGIGGTMMLRLEVKQLRNRLDHCYVRHAAEGFLRARIPAHEEHEPELEIS